MALIVIALRECAGLTVLWTAVNVNAVREAALRIDELLADATVDVRRSYVRFLSKREEPGCRIDIPFSKRRETIGSVLTQQVILMTEDGFLVENSFAYTNLKIEADISLKDESQQGGTPAHAFQLASLHPSGIAVNVGDPSQTMLAVDSSNMAMKRLVQEIESRDPGIRCRSLQWVPVNDWCRQTCQFLSLPNATGDVTDFDEMDAICDYLVNETLIDMPSSADMAALRECAPPQLTVPKSYRLPCFSYHLVVAAGYDHLVTFQESDDRTRCSIQLGELPHVSHNSRKYLLPDWAQIVCIQPWGWSLRASEHSHFCNVLAIMIHICMQRESRYFVDMQLGLVVSHRKLFLLVRAHFQKQQPDVGFTLTSRHSVNFTADPSLGMLANIAAAMGKQTVDVTQGDVVWIFTKAPWVVRDFIGITTSMSAVGSEKLDVLFYKQHPGLFVDKDDQNIVAHTRHKGHLYVYCDLNRVRGFGARFAAMVIRCCPVVYWSADESHSVEDRLLMFLPATVQSLSQPYSQAAPSSSVDVPFVSLPPQLACEPDVSQILEKASASWDVIPLCVAVHVTWKNNVDDVRLLFARPYTPPDPKSMNVPNNFWLDDWTTWSWDSLEWTREIKHWSLRPRWPTWKLRIGRKNVAGLKHNFAQRSKFFQMNVFSDSELQSVQVCIMPAYVFPTHGRWTSVDLINLMSQVRDSFPDSAFYVTRPETQVSGSDCGDEAADEVSSQSETYFSCAEELGAAAFSETSLNAHDRALEVWNRVSADLASVVQRQDANTLYKGLSVEVPWCRLCFNVRSMARTIFRAKLAKIYSDSCQEHGQLLARPIDIERIASAASADILRNDLLFDYLARFFSDVLSLLPDYSPLWWNEILTPQEWSNFRTIDFIKHQLSHALQNMHRECTVTDDRTMFLVSRKTMDKDVKDRFPGVIRLLLPRGMALFLHAQLRSLQSQPKRPSLDSLCFDLKDAGQGNSITFEFKQRFAQDSFAVYKSPFILSYLRWGVVQNVCQDIGGCSRLSISLMTLAYETDEAKSIYPSTMSSSAANSDCLKRLFSDYEASKSAVVNLNGGIFLGPTVDDLRSFLKRLEKERSHSWAYRSEQLLKIDVERYIAEGLQADLLSRGRYNRVSASSNNRRPRSSAASSTRSRNFVMQ